MVLAHFDRYFLNLCCEKFKILARPTRNEHGKSHRGGNTTTKKQATMSAPRPPNTTINKSKESHPLSPTSVSSESVMSYSGGGVAPRTKKLLSGTTTSSNTGVAEIISSYYDDPDPEEPETLTNGNEPASITKKEIEQQQEPDTPSKLQQPTANDYWLYAFMFLCMAAIAIGVAFLVKGGSGQQDPFSGDTTSIISQETRAPSTSISAPVSVPVPAFPSPASSPATNSPTLRIPIADNLATIPTIPTVPIS